MRRNRAADRGRRARAALRTTVLAAASIAAGLFAGAPLLEAAVRLVDPERTGLHAIGVQGARHLSAAGVAALTGAASGVPLADVDVRAVEDRLRAHPWIAEAAALAWPPNRLLVGIRERTPEAIAELGAGREPHFVDAAGVPFAPARGAPREALPRLVVAREFEPGRPHAALAAAVRVAHSLPPLGLALPVSVGISEEGDPDGFVLRLRGFPARIVLGVGDLGPKLSRLASLLAAGVREAARAESIDVRFADRAVLRGVPQP